MLGLLFLIYFLGAPHVFTRFPIYRAFMQSMPFFGIIAISATFVVTLGEIDLSFPSIVGITSLTFGLLPGSLSAILSAKIIIIKKFKFIK